MNRRAALMLLLASITSASLPSASIADKFILIETAEANHNEHRVKGNKPSFRVLVSAGTTHSEICSWSCSGDMNCILAFCLRLTLAHPDLVLLNMSE